MRKKIKKPVHVMIIAVIAICVFVPLISSILKGCGGAGTVAQEGTTSQSSTQAPSRPVSNYGEGNTDQSITKAEDDASAKSAEGTETVESAENSGVSVGPFYSGNGTVGSTSIGNLTVVFRSEDAKYGIGEVNGKQMDSIIFHDGVEDDMKGYMFAFQVDREANIDTVEEAQDSVSEYIPGGSGISYEWEETEDSFVRKVSGYDNEAEGAFIFYTVVPKYADWDRNLYSIIVTGYENDLIKESSYNSMMDAVFGYLPDSSLLSMAYKDAAVELKQILKNKSATGDSLGGLQELGDSHTKWIQDVYGVKNEEELEVLSEEEKADLLWKYKDPVGYKQAHGETAGEAQEDGNTEELDAEENATLEEPGF